MKALYIAEPSHKHWLESILKDYFDEVAYEDSASIPEETPDPQDAKYVFLPRSPTGYKTDCSGFETSNRLKENYDVATFIYGPVIGDASSIYTQMCIHPAIESNKFDSYCEFEYGIAEFQLRMCIESALSKR